RGLAQVSAIECDVPPLTQLSVNPVAVSDFGSIGPGSSFVAAWVRPWAPIGCRWVAHRPPSTHASAPAEEIATVAAVPSTMGSGTEALRPLSAASTRIVVVGVGHGGGPSPLYFEHADASSAPVTNCVTTNRPAILTLMSALSGPYSSSRPSASS